MKSIAAIVFALLLALPTFAQNQWKITEKSNAMDNIKIRTASLESDAGAGEKATLIIRYTGNKVEVYVATEDVLDDDPVRVKFDDSKPEMQFWGRSTDYHALFASNSQKIVERLKASKKFYIEYHPFQRTPATAVFTLPQAQAAVPTPNLDEVKKNSENARNSPAAAAALARDGHMHTREELEELVKQGKASKCAVITNPAGAEVFIDGNKAGVTPFALTLIKTEKPRVVTVKLAGYKTVEKEYDPDGKVIPIALTLEKEQ